MEGVARVTVAGHLGKDVGVSAYGSLVFFQDEDTGSLTITNPCRSTSKGMEARYGLSERDRARLLLNPPTASGVMAASAPPVMTASAYPWRMARERFANGVGGGGASRNNGQAGTLRVVGYGYVARGHVGNHGRYKQGRDAVGPLVVVLFTFGDERVDASDAGTDIHAQPFRIHSGPALIHGLPGCSHGVQGKQIGFAGCGGFYSVICRVEILDLCGYFYAQIVRIECPDEINPAGTCFQAFPKGLDAVSYGEMTPIPVMTTLFIKWHLQF